MKTDYFVTKTELLSIVRALLEIDHEYETRALGGLTQCLTEARLLDFRQMTLNDITETTSAVPPNARQFAISWQARGKIRAKLGALLTALEVKPVELVKPEPKAHRLGALIPAEAK